MRSMIGLSSDDDSYIFWFSNYVFSRVFSENFSRYWKRCLIDRCRKTVFRKNSILLIDEGGKKEYSECRFLFCMTIINMIRLYILYENLNTILLKLLRYSMASMNKLLLLIAAQRVFLSRKINYNKEISQVDEQLWFRHIRSSNQESKQK